MGRDERGRGDRKRGGRWGEATGAAATERGAADGAGRKGRRQKKEGWPMGRGDRGGAQTKRAADGAGREGRDGSRTLDTCRWYRPLKLNHNPVPNANFGAWIHENICLISLRSPYSNFEVRFDIPYSEKPVPLAKPTTKCPLKLNHDLLQYRKRKPRSM